MISGLGNYENFMNSGNNQKQLQSFPEFIEMNHLDIEEKDYAQQVMSEPEQEGQYNKKPKHENNDNLQFQSHYDCMFRITLTQSQNNFSMSLTQSFNQLNLYTSKNHNNSIHFKSSQSERHRQSQKESTYEENFEFVLEIGEFKNCQESIDESREHQEIQE